MGEMSADFSTLEQRLALLVQMPTVTSDSAACRAAIQSLSEELGSLGMQVETQLSDHPYLIATTRPTNHPRILLVAHLDVVPPTNGAEHQLRLNGDTLTGRGVHDMKFAAACYLQLAHELHEQGTLGNYDFGIMFTTDEEIGGVNGAAEILNNGWSTDLAIIPDGGENWTVELGAKGLICLQLTAHGRSAHGSRPWEGDNAIDKLVAVLNEIHFKYPYTSQNQLTISVNQISGGQAINQIADSAQTVIDIRAFTAEELKSAEEGIREIADKYSADVEYISSGNPVALDLDDSTVQAALQSLEQFLGRPVEFTRSYGATDGRWFTKANIPSFIVRPQGGDIHGPGEWLLREDLPKFYDFLRLLTDEIALIAVDKTVPEVQTVAV
jgi:succinyl-diaminopimelate desuccinylase